MSFAKAGDIVKGVLEQYGINRESLAIFNVWEKELGHLAKNIRLTGKKNGCLLVDVDKPAYMQELRYRKKEFIDKINGHFGKKVVDDIKINRVR